jgi:hypothetical protein
MNLRERVESLLPNWQTWYPSLFEAAQDLGLIRARVCPLSSLMLSNRHAAVQSEAEQAFREQWSVESEEAEHIPLTRGLSLHPKGKPNQKRPVADGIGRNPRKL